MKTDAGKSPTSNNQNAADRPSQSEGLSAVPPFYGIGAVDRMARNENRTGLPDNLKAGIEQLSGLSMDDVRVHYNSPKPAPLGALAYTQGTEIHVGAGQERHLSHEAWHVVQQMQGQVKPTLQVDGLAINDDPTLEREADEMGAHAQTIPRDPANRRGAQRRTASHEVIQGVFTEHEMQQIALLNQADRIQFLAQASEEDLESYYDSTYFGNNYLGGEEADEISELRRNLRPREEVTPSAFQNLYSSTDLTETSSFAPFESNLFSIGVSEEESELASMESEEGTGPTLLTPQSAFASTFREEWTGFFPQANQVPSFPFTIPSKPLFTSVNAPEPGYFTSNLPPMPSYVPPRFGSTSFPTSNLGREERSVFGQHPPTAHPPPIVGNYSSWASFPNQGWVSFHHEPQITTSTTSIIGNTSFSALLPGQKETTWSSFREPKSDYQSEDKTEKTELEPGESYFDYPQADDKASMVGKRKREMYRGVEGEDTELSLQALTDQFKTMTVSFTSSIDNAEHVVYPDANRNDVIVESNPTPLKTIIANKMWQGLKLSKAHRTALNNLQTDAANAMANFNRSQASGNLLRKALRAIAKYFRDNLAGIDLPQTDLTGSTNHGQNAGTVEGSYVEAKPLSLNSKTVGHGPKNGRLMAAVRKAARTINPQKDESSSYKQMHLLNDNVFGPGELWNLTPGTAQTNSTMEHDVETPLKRAIIDKGLVMTFEATVNYTHDPNSASDVDIDQNPAKFLFKDISFKATEWQPDVPNKKYSPVANSDPDIKAIHGSKINWDYGSLTKLVPKPKILDPTTTTDALETAGIPKSQARRIVAFVQANAGVNITGQNKQGKLAAQIKAWEDKTKVPKVNHRKIDTNAWNANLVLWT